MGGGGESDEDKEKLAEMERERLEAIREAEERRAAKHAKMEAERESIRQGVRDKVRYFLTCIFTQFFPSSLNFHVLPLAVIDLLFFPPLIFNVPICENSSAFLSFTLPELPNVLFLFVFICYFVLFLPFSLSLSLSLSRLTITVWHQEKRRKGS